MSKYIIKVNETEYHSYQDLCNDIEIDFKEFMKVKHENPQMSQFELLNYFFDEVIIKMQDSSFRVGNLQTKLKKIEANCPSCWAFSDDIVYKNSGPIVRIYCSKCGLVYNEEDAHKNGYDNIIDFWNHIGIYCPHE